jgi:hypothetical protein
VLAFFSCKKDGSLFVDFLFTCFKRMQKRGYHCLNDYKTLGTSAHALLAASPYSSLQIEIQYMPGYTVDTASISNLTNFLNTYINNPSGIQVIQQEIDPSGKSALLLNEIVNIEKKHRSIFI